MKLMNATRLLTWALLMAMPLWFASCKKENGGDGDEPVKPRSVEGSWKITDMQLSDGKDAQSLFDIFKEIDPVEGAKLQACLTDIKINLNADGKVTGTPSPKCESNDADDFNPAAANSRWSVNGDKITITDTDGPNTYDLTLNGNTMKWTITEKDDLDGDGIDDTYTMIIEFKRA